MTRLVGLKMQGVRSIGEEPHVLHFLNPLTIIQGENGTGKTTIIEALNYVTSGSLPAGKMGSFIHNNKLMKKSRVDALVQLEFVDFRNNHCTATKRLASLLSKNDKVTTKSDEFTLHIKNSAGSTRSVSAKISDFNREIEALFGVPTAILQHVIFCHQEESTWPLSEPKELKLKFDAIFEVEKVVKVVDSLKRAVKQYEIELKTVLAELPHIEKNVTQMATQYMQMEENRKKMESIRALLSTKEAERLTMRSTIEGLQAELATASASEKEMDSLTNRIKIQEARLRNVDKYSGTKEQLWKEMNNFKTSSDFANSEAEKQRADAERKKLKAEMTSIQQQQQSLRQQVSRIEGQQMVLDKSKNDYTTILNEATERFNIEAKPNEFVQKLKDQIANYENELEALKSSHAQDRSVYTKNIDGLREEIAKLTSVDSQKRREIAQLRSSIHRLENELKNMDESTNRMSELQDEVNTRTDEIRRTQSDRDKSMTTLKKKLNTLSVYPQVTGEVTDLEMLTTRLDGLVFQNIGTFTGFVNLTLGDKATQLDTAKKDLEERKKQMTEAEKEMQNAVKKIPSLRAQQREAEEKLKNVDQNALTVQGNLLESIQTMRATVNTLQKAEQSVASLTRQMESQNVDELRERLTESEQKIEGHRAEIQRLSMVVADCDNRQQQLRYFEDNLANFEANEQIETLKLQIEKIRKNGQRAVAEISQEIRKFSSQLTAVQNEIQKNIGARDQLELSGRSLRNQLQSESMDDIKKKLKQKIHQKAVLEGAIYDLQKFAKVVDDSIINYHNQKMIQINEILQELWPRVYQGNDIEFIQIRSKPTDDRRKSYDYSVIMIVDQTELEMRDRCSAGQKMLASILIRIALSEVFGSNCSILALDEPTTNLDSVKVENMGTMLRDLLEACKNEDGTSSLQLIVITHDMRLVEHLYTTCRPELVYGLSKDETGTSRIKTYRSVIDEPDDVRMAEL
ncbi:hypothetical protein M3Y94_00197900 [Aphelenchoides besseyi]|nr:hypothetical protein M3Y94_00197900 [Aphelenchoides besseyi]KAI6236733.1 DNA repair protein RAD50 [Aphelenchoides besseyi]